MTEQRIAATATELATLADAITDANAASQDAQRANTVAAKVFTMFCEGHGIPGATFVGIKDGQVTVQVPEAKPELVKESA